MQASIASLKLQAHQLVLNMCVWTHLSNSNKIIALTKLRIVQFAYFVQFVLKFDRCMGDRPGSGGQHLYVLQFTQNPSSTRINRIQEGLEIHPKLYWIG